MPCEEPGKIIQIAVPHIREMWATAYSGEQSRIALPYCLAIQGTPAIAAISQVSAEKRGAEPGAPLPLRDAEILIKFL